MAASSLLLVSALPGPALRQAEAQGEDIGANLTLVSKPIVHRRPQDPLDLRLQVTNTGTESLQGLQVQVAGYGRVTSRIELHETFDGVDAPISLGFPQRVGTSLEPQESTTVTPRLTIEDVLGSPEQGVYPIEVTLRNRSRTREFDSLVTHVTYYTEPIEAPLNLVLVVPLADVPARGPSGAFAADLEGVWPLEAGLDQEEGWVTGVLDAIQSTSSARLRIGLAPSPRLVEEIADLANGYARADGDEIEETQEDSDAARNARAALTALRSLMVRSGMQPLLSPYAPADLPTLSRRLPLENLGRQLTVGQQVLEEALPGATFQPQWLFAPGSRWDVNALESARITIGSRLRTFFSADLFQPPVDETVSGCPTPAIAGSFTCAVTVEPVPGERTVGYVQDPDLQERFGDLARTDDEGLALHRLFTETALIHLEQPGVPGRVLHATVPSYWHPHPDLSRRLFGGLARAPWLKTRTPGAGLAVVEKRRKQQPVEEAPTLAGTPGSEYFDALAGAEAAWRRFSEIEPPEDRLTRLRRNLLIAQSRTWWADALTLSSGLDYVEESEAEIERELGLITIDGPDTTLTSRRASMELFVSNEADFPVTIDIDFFAEESDEIRINESDPEDLNDVTIDARSLRNIEVEAIAESSGFFSIAALVQTPQSGFEIARKEITVRSTNFNQIAVVLTVGALAFLILFYVIRVLRRRARPSEAA